MKGFKELGIEEPILKVIEKEGFEEPTEIQEKSIPLVLEGKDVIAGSATGSGKTLAFCAGIIDVTQPGDGIQSIVLTPTRELAQQVAKALTNFSQHKNISVACVYGGEPIKPQMRDLKTADAVIGTPGRTLDHLRRGTMNLENIKICVLDEADRMLDMGFRDDVEAIMNHCPEYRQNLFFSATITGELSKMAQNYMRDPTEVFGEKLVDPSRLDQIYYDCPDNRKFSLLVHLLKEEESDLVLVFCNTRKTTDFIAKNLQKAGIDSQAIHGGYSQNKRNRKMDDFHKQGTQVLVATDVAARGLDIEGISHVYNYDIPRDPKSYRHRIGRTARAGEEGKAINILGSDDHRNFRKVQKNNDIDRVEMPDVKSVPIRWTPGRN